MGLEVPVRKSAAERERIKRRMIKGASLRAELTKWLMTTQPWDLFLIVFHELHRAGHLLWPTNDSINPELLLEVYRAVDRALGQILLAAQDEKSAIAIFALHGMGAYNSQDHFTRYSTGSTTVSSGVGHRATPRASRVDQHPDSISSPLCAK